MKINNLDKLVSDIIEQIDYDLWKEVYLHEDDEDFGLDNQVRDLIETWYINETSTDKET